MCLNSCCWYQERCTDNHDIFVSVLGSISFFIYLAKILMLNSMIIRFTQSTEGGAILIPDASFQGLFLRSLDTERARVKDEFQFFLVLDGDDSSSSSILHCNLGIVAKSGKYSTSRIFRPKINTKNALFTTFPNLRQNSVNAFEVMPENYKVFISHIPIIPIKN